jgi:hypothetical protein
MSFRLSFHLALLDPTRAHWLDDPPDTSCKDSTRQYAVDDPLLSCNSRSGVRVPPPAPKGAGQMLYSKASNGSPVSGTVIPRVLVAPAPLRYVGVHPIIHRPSMSLLRRPTPGEIMEGGRFARPLRAGRAIARNLRNQLRLRRHSCNSTRRLISRTESSSPEGAPEGRPR